MRRIWSTEETNRFLDLYPNTMNRDLAELFSVTIPQIKDKAKKLKIKKSPEHLIEVSKWSIGKHFSPKSEFKKGQKPVNTKFNSCITLRYFKGRPYKFIRLEENKWLHLHRFIYKKHHGSIPEEKVIIFSDGNSMNLNIDNLIPVTRAELMIRNSVHRPKDNTELYLYLTNAFNFRDKLKTLRAKRREENEEQKKIRIAELKVLRAKRREENEEQKKIRIAELKALRAKRREENEEQKKIRIAELKALRAKRREENKRSKNIEKRERRLQRKRDKRVSRGVFINAISYKNNLMELGEQYTGLAIKMMRDPDIAKDAIMNSLCYFIEGNIETSQEEFKNRLVYECKLLNKDSYKKISFHDLEYKLTNLSEIPEY